MRENYQKPELEVVEFNIKTSIAASGTPNNPNTPGGAAHYEEV